MNGFEKHGIKHLSNSSISLWESNPAQWVMSYLLKEKRPSSAAMWRGIAVEDGVVVCLDGGTLTDAVAAALARFDKEITFADEKSEKERAGIAPMIELAVAELEQYGKPQFSIDGSQQRVSITSR